MDPNAYIYGEFGWSGFEGARTNLTRVTVCSPFDDRKIVGTLPIPLRPHDFRRGGAMERERPLVKNPIGVA